MKAANLLKAELKRKGVTHAQPVAPPSIRSDKKEVDI